MCYYKRCGHLTNLSPESLLKKDLDVVKERQIWDYRNPLLLPPAPTPRGSYLTLAVPLDVLAKSQYSQVVGDIFYIQVTTLAFSDDRKSQPKEGT